MEKKTKVGKRILTFALALVMLLGVSPIVIANDFELIAHNGDLVANEFTRYYAEVEQDADTKLITVSFIIANEDTRAGARDIVLNGMGAAVTFSGSVAPLQYNPSSPTAPPLYNVLRMYLTPGIEHDIDEFYKYCYRPLNKFDTVSSQMIRNDNTGRFMGAIISAATDDDAISIAPGEAVTFVQFFFIPTDGGTETLSESMFRFQFVGDLGTLKRHSTWLGNGSRYMGSYPNFPGAAGSPYYVVNPDAFKMHFLQAPPTGLVADNANRTITNYNATTMEWSTDGVTFSSAALTIPDGPNTVYVRYRGTAYSSDNPEYGNYKRTMPSPAAQVVFQASFYSCADDVVLTKSSRNLATHLDGKARVGDTIEYTVTVKNEGHPMSMWADTTLTDVMPAGVTFAGNVYINDVLQVAVDDYTFENNTLTIELGDLPGGTEKVIKFEVTINELAYGTRIINSVLVEGTDGKGGDDLDLEADDGDGHGGGGQEVADRSAVPTINEVTEGDSTISGTGVPGATITVTLPDGGPAITTTVVPDGSGGGTWTVNVTGREPEAGDVIKAVQTEPGKDTSPEVSTTVVGRPDPDKVRVKTSENTSRTDGTRRVTDTLRYTITVTNAGDPKSLWENIIIIDELPTEVDYVPGSVRINGSPAGSAASYTAGVLTVNLAPIAGGVTTTVTFDAVINETAYGKVFKNTALVDEEEVTEIIDPPPVIGRTEKPDVDEVNEGDRVITGEGLNGATITVTFPDGVTRRNATVVNGIWSVTVPASINLLEDDELSVTQTLAPNDPSEPVIAVVMAKRDVIPSLQKTSEVIESNYDDGRTHVGDLIEYTITVKNLGPKSVWTGATLKDVIPEGLIYTAGSVLLNGHAPTFHSYDSNPSSAKYRTLEVWIGDIAYGETKVITFTAEVAPNAHGMTIKNSVSVAGLQNGDPDIEVEDETEEDGDGHEIVDKSQAPTVSNIVRGDRAIRGRGVPGSDIIVTLPDGTKIETEVDDDGDWKADLPPGVELNTGDVVKAIQIEDDKDPSDEVSRTVVDKSGRSVKGYVWPLAQDNPLIDASYDLLGQHAITVELRETFLTPAGLGFSTKAVVTTDYTDPLIGEFVLENIPFGTYVLVIHRPGYLLRAMMVTISASDPDLIMLAPPGVVDNGIFNLWWGDVNGDLRIDGLDSMMIMEIINVNIMNSAYNPACDLNASGTVDGLDIMMVLEHWNAVAFEYAGAQYVDFFT